MVNCISIGMSQRYIVYRFKNILLIKYFDIYLLVYYDIAKLIKSIKNTGKCNETISSVAKQWLKN